MQLIKQGINYSFGEIDRYHDLLPHKLF